MPGGAPARGACRGLIRPPARGRHRNHSATPVPSACGNGRPRLPPLTQPPPAPQPAGSFRAAGAGRDAQRRAGLGARGRPGRAGRGRNGAAASPSHRPAGADSPVSLGLSNCPAARRPLFPETAAGLGRGGGVGWPPLPEARVPSRASCGPRALGWTATRVGDDGHLRAPRRRPGAPHPAARFPGWWRVRALQLPRWPLGVRKVRFQGSRRKCAPRPWLNRSGRCLRAWLRFSDAGLGSPHPLGLGARSRRPGHGGRKLLTFARGGTDGRPWSRLPGRCKAGDKTVNRDEAGAQRDAEVRPAEPGVPRGQDTARPAPHASHRRET